MLPHAQPTRRSWRRAGRASVNNQLVPQSLEARQRRLPPGRADPGERSLSCGNNRAANPELELHRTSDHALGACQVRGSIDHDAQAAAVVERAD